MSIRRPNKYKKREIYEKENKENVGFFSVKTPMK
jgi:hypothetical protein